VVQVKPVSEYPRIRRVKMNATFSLMNKAIRYALALLLVIAAISAEATTYTMSSGSRPTCSGGSWSSSGGTYTCSGSFTLASGDSIQPSGSITVVAYAGITLSGNNTIGSSSVTVALQTNWGGISATGATIYGDLTSNGGAINLTNTTLNGSINTNGTSTLNGGSVTGSVTADNGITTTNGVNINGSVTASSGSISLSGGNVYGAVYSACCTVTTTNTNLYGGVASGQSSSNGGSTVTINGGTVSGAIYARGGSGISISNATVTSGSITTTNVPIVISNSTIGSASSVVNVTTNNSVTITNSTVYGSVTGGSWSTAVSIDTSSSVHGTCQSSVSSTSSPSTFNNRCDGGTTLTCNPPANAPAIALTCVCDNFTRSTLNPSTIYSSNWVVASSGSTVFTPTIVNSGYMRLTQNTGNNATSAVVPGIFPAAGNYISVEFKQYSYNTSGYSADGMAVTLSDYSKTVVPGGYGGSLGYAPRTGYSGFAGGWLGVALDEYGNYSNPTEGRTNGPGFYPGSVGARGPGAGANGYRWMGGSLSVGNIDDPNSSTPSFGNSYQIIVDARGATSSNQVLVYVNRDSTTKNGQNYTNLFGGSSGFNAYSEASYALSQGWISKIVPDYWRISFTGSTGGGNDIHEISGLRVCAQTIYPPNNFGGVASGFNAIDEAYPFPVDTSLWQYYQQGHIYTKLMGVPFKLSIGALSSSGIKTDYVVSGTKSVTVKLVDNSDGVCVLDNSKTNYCSSSCLAKTAVTGGSQTLSFSASDSGQKQTSNFTLTTAYKNLAVLMDDGMTKACSTDSFSVRPTAFTSVATTTATQTSASTGIPKFKTGKDVFDLAVIANSAGYSGTPKININAMAAIKTDGSTGGTVGAFSPSVFTAAVSGSPSSTQSKATTSIFVYGEAGTFSFIGYCPSGSNTSPLSVCTPSASMDAQPRGIYDGVDTTLECNGLTVSACDTLRSSTWTGVDSPSTQGDCITGSYSNAKSSTGTYDTNSDFGKYGCNVGIVANTGNFGRFIPEHFETTVTAPMTCTGLTFASVCPANYLVYSGQPFTTSVTAYALGGTGASGVTTNYVGTGSGVVLSAWNALGGATQNPPSNGGTLSGSVGSSTTSFASFSSGNGSGSQVYTFTASPTKPTDVYIRAIDNDGVTSLQSPSTASVEGGTKVVTGRMHLLNAYGSELLPIRVPVRIEYWAEQTSGAYQWLLNLADSLTTINTASISIGNCQGNLVSQCTATGGTPNSGTITPKFITRINSTQVTSTAVYAGEATMVLTRAGCPSGTCPTGGMDIALSLGSSGVDTSCNTTHPTGITNAALAWLRYPWCSTSNDPNARIKFGSSKAPYIFLRERY